MSLPTKLLTAAMASPRDVYVSFDGKTNSVYVHCYKNDTIREGFEFNEHASLDYPGADEKLAEILETVEALG